MAMNKAEKAEMDALRVRLALAWPPSPPKPVDLDVARAAADVKWVRLWWMNRHSRSVGFGMTDGFQCSTTAYTDEQMERRYSGGSRISMSQGAGGPWFATEADAYRALHYAVAEECAAELFRITERIAAL